MNEFRLHKRRLLINLSIFLILIVVSLFMIIDGASAFKQQWRIIAIMCILLIEIPVVVSSVLISLKVINSIIKEANSNKVLQETELNNYEKEVEEKVKEADDLTFNLNRLIADVGKHEDWDKFGLGLLNGISKQLEIITGLVYKHSKEEGLYKSTATYAYYSEQKPSDFKEGEGLAGQVVKDNKAIFLSDIPEGYVEVVSGLGNNKPSHLVILPIYKNNNVVGIVELASFKSFGDSFARRIKDISESFGNLAPVV